MEIAVGTSANGVGVAAVGGFEKPQLNYFLLMIKDKDSKTYSSAPIAAKLC